jgi:hypothetical protein
MTRDPPPPYCLSRQHPELAARSPAPHGPIDHRRDSPNPDVEPASEGIFAPNDGRKAPTGKHL